MKFYFFITFVCLIGLITMAQKTNKITYQENKSSRILVKSKGTASVKRLEIPTMASEDSPQQDLSSIEKKLDNLSKQEIETKISELKVLEEKNNLNEKANSNKLDEKDKKILTYIFRHKAILHKILLDRELEVLENEIL